MAFETSVVVGVESLLHAGRLVVENLKELNSRDEILDVVGYQVFCTALGIRLILGAWLENKGDGGTDSISVASVVVCVLPSVALVLELIAMRLYSFGVIVVAILVLVDLCIIRVDMLIVAFFLVQLHAGQTRSNLLRLGALSAFFSSIYLDELPRRYVAIIGMELASWATERHMLPWRLENANVCCGPIGRFLMGFFVGVYFVNGSDEIRLRPCDRRVMCFPETVRGLACHGTDVFARYRVSPMGVLFAYVEGLGIVPYRFTMSEDGRARLFILGMNVLVADTTGWKQAASSEAFACASRFPFRRLLLGILLRTSSVNRGGLLWVQ